MRASCSFTVAAIAVIAACNGDAVMTTPTESPTPPTALQPAIRLVVIDSTRLPFVGTRGDRAAGQYVFLILDSVRAIAPGDLVAVKQGGLFLGRVLSVSRSVDRLTLELAPAGWSEVIPTFNVHIPFTPGAGSAPSPYGEVRWGPWQLVSGTEGKGERTPLPQVSALQAAAVFRTASGAAADLFDFPLTDFLLNNLDLCVVSGVVSGCENITAKVIDAHFVFTGGIDVGSSFDIPTLSLSAHANVDEQLNTLLDFELTGSGKVKVDFPLSPDLGFVRKFSVAGVEGTVKVGFIIGVEGDITGTTVEPHVQVSDTIHTGDSFSTSDGWKFHFAGVGHFDAGAKVIDLGTLGVKLSVGPTVEVKFGVGDGGFDLGAGVDGFEHAQVNLAGLLGFENWHAHVDAGVEGTLEGKVKVSVIGLDLGATETFPFAGVNLLDLWGTGDLDVRSSTMGSDVFPGQMYTTSVARADPNEAPPWSAVLSSTLGVNDSHQFTGGLLCRQFFQGAPLIPPFIEAPQDCNLVGTAHTVNLTGLAPNCTAAQPLPATVHVLPRHPFDFTARLTSLTLSVVCRSMYAVVQSQIATLLASEAINVAGIATALEAKLTAAATARDAGDAAAAVSALQDLLNQLRAQSGKHITTAAAAEVQGLATLLQQCYVTVVPTCSTLPPSAPVALGAPAP